MRIQFISLKTFITAEPGGVLAVREGCSGCKTTVIKTDTNQIGIWFVSYNDLEVIEQSKYILGGGSALEKVNTDPIYLGPWEQGSHLVLGSGGDWQFVKVSANDWIAQESYERGYWPPKKFKGEHIRDLEEAFRAKELDVTLEEYYQLPYDDTHYTVEADERGWVAYDRNGHKYKGKTFNDLKTLPRGKLYKLIFNVVNDWGYCVEGYSRDTFRYWS